MLIKINVEYSAGNKIYAELETSVVTVNRSQEDSSEMGPAQETDPSVSPITVDFSVLKKKNANTVGWIYGGETPINYPIVKTQKSADYDYYSKHLIDGSANKSGSIFLDLRNIAPFENINTILYGHSMKNGTMFAYILRYTNQEFYDKHSYFWIYTPDKTYRISVIAGYYTLKDSNDYRMFKNSDELHDYINLAISKSGFETDADINLVSKIVQLSTCAYSNKSDRFILVGSAEQFN